jgi:hypothetical protein
MNHWPSWGKGMLWVDSWAVLSGSWQCWASCWHYVQVPCCQIKAWLVVHVLSVSVCRLRKVRMLVKNLQKILQVSTSFKDLLETSTKIFPSWGVRYVPPVSSSLPSRGNDLNTSKNQASVAVPRASPCRSWRARAPMGLTHLGTYLCRGCLM